VLRESAEHQERAAPSECAGNGERAVEEESAKAAERAVLSESIESDERAVSRESAGCSERAGTIACRHEHAVVYGSRHVRLSWQHPVSTAHADHHVSVRN
jgi:hypothetical protein